MSVPGDTIEQHFQVFIGTTPVTGLTTGSFTFTGLVSGVIVAFTPTITEVSGGFYELSYTLPAATTEFSRFVVSNTAAHTIVFPDISGEIEATDLDVILASVVRPVATVSSDFTPQGELQIVYIAGDTRSIQLTITDTSGNPIDIQNDYNSPGFGIRSQDGTSSIDEISGASITSVINVVTIAIGAGLNFQTFITDGVDTLPMKHDFQAILTSTSEKQTLVRGSWLLKRQEFRS